MLLQQHTLGLIGGEFGWAGFLAVYLLYKINQPTKNHLLWEKVAQNATINLFFLGLGWPWVGEFVGFIIIFTLSLIHI